jgi:hypothetical protein
VHETNVRPGVYLVMAQFMGHNDGTESERMKSENIGKVQKYLRTSTKVQDSLVPTVRYFST